MTARSQPQVTIIGGGPAGLATALSLAAQAVDVTVVERTTYSELRVGEHLPPSALTALAQLGVEFSHESQEHLVCPGISSAWGESKISGNSFFFSTQGHGLNLSRPAFDESMARAAEHAGVVIHLRTKVSDARRTGSQWKLRLERDSATWEQDADYVVDASGRRAGFATRVGRERIVFDRLVGLTAILKSKGTASDHDSRVLVESCADGWWYCASLAAGRLAATYMTDSDILATDPDDAHAFWSARTNIGTASRDRLANFASPAEVRVRSAATQRLDRVVGDGWLAVGDAAIAFDPLSSHGIEKGLTGGIAAAQTVCAMLDDQTAAADDYQKNIDDQFDEYLRLRAAYYRMESRWPNSDFWQRRHIPIPAEIQISIDPLTVVRSAHPGRDLPGSRRSLFESYSVADADFLLSLAQESVSAHRLASLYKSRANRHASDRDIILSIQSLLHQGDLISASQTPTLGAKRFPTSLDGVSA